MLTSQFAMTAEPPNSPLMSETQDVMLAVFVVDFLTNDFEGGVVYSFPKIDHDGPLFEVDYQPPSDFGSVEFSYAPTGEVVFEAKVDWDGSGEILIPASLQTPTDFRYRDSPAERPAVVEHYDFSRLLESFLVSPEVMASEIVMFTDVEEYRSIFAALDTRDKHFDRAWSAVARTELAHQALNQNNQLSMYLYVPSVSMMDVTAAKWLLFLHFD